nr:hypothetical protein [Tanacetum cinerariifolium]
MEILLEPTLNKLSVERFDTSAGNPVKEVLLKLNLPDHMSILTDSRILKDGGEERFDTSARNPVKEVLLKLNLPDHMSILTDSRILKDGGE